MSHKRSQAEVPITMGSTRSVSRDIGPFRCTHAWFPPGCVLEPHVHDRATFGIILAGGFDLTFTNPAIRRSVLSCSSGTVFTEPAGEIHGNLVGTGGASVLAIQIDPECNDRTVNPIRSVLVNEVNHFKNGNTEAAARRIVSEMKLADSLTDLAIESLVLDMLVGACRRAPGDLKAKDPSPWLNEALRYVHAHFRESPRIADIAQAAGVHPTYLASVFRRLYDMPLGTYVRQLRLDWARDRLANSDASIASIAFEAGFADQPHLTRTLKRDSGYTPAQYRRLAN